MQQEVTARRMAWAALALLCAAALAGCGASASGRPVPTPVQVHAVPFKPAPPQLPPHHPAGAVYVLDLTNIGHITPAKLAFASNASLLSVSWNGWGGATAVGHGTVLLRTCKPDCATSPLARYPATVKLSDLKACHAARFYVGSSVVAETSHGPWQLASFVRDPC
jgi:hypothetical protein